MKSSRVHRKQMADKYEVQPGRKKLSVSLLCMCGFVRLHVIVCGCECGRMHFVSFCSVMSVTYCLVSALRALLSVVDNLAVLWFVNSESEKGSHQLCVL
jgi:hypothetical protein